MRHPRFRTSEEDAVALLARAPFLHLATTTPDGVPVLRALDAAIVDGAVVFHGAPVGEKARCVGRPAVVSAEELIAHLPSWFLGEVQACAASTLYRSAQAKGPLERVDDAAAKARALQALMGKLQPEGRHAPVAASDARYASELEGTLVFRVPLAEVTGKAKLAQHRSPEERLRILEGLWRRGAPGDVEAMEAIRAASPGTPVPAILEPVGGASLHAALPPEAAPEAARLLEGRHWCLGVPAELVPSSHLASQAWVGARDGEGRLVATARALSDGRTAWIWDVAMDRSCRGRGLGRRLLALLLQHPAVRTARAVRVATQDPQGLYAQLGFVEVQRWERPAAVTEMVLVRT